MRPRRRQAQRPRAGRAHPAAPHLLRDAGQLLLRRLLQARRDRVRLGVRDQPEIPGHPRRPASGDGAPHRRRGARAVAGDRRLAGLTGSTDSATRTISGRWATPARAGRAPRSSSIWSGQPGKRANGEGIARGGVRAAGRGRPVPRDLEPGLHAVRPLGRWHADAAAQAVGGHRRGPRADRRGHAGRGRQLPHRPLPAADRAGGDELVGAPVSGRSAEEPACRTGCWPTTPVR